MSSNAIKWICVALIGVALCLLAIFYMLGFWGFQPSREIPGPVASSAPSVPISYSPGAPIEYSFGLEEISDEEYAKIPQIVIPVYAQALPAEWSLAQRMPPVGCQGRQGSCVGWAAAYVLKSYQEEIERSWGLDNQAHLFSPAFIYNQLNGGKNRGINMKRALDLLATKGCATMATMPYSSSDWLTSPSDQATEEAKNYKVASWGKVRLNIDAVKQFLISGCPVIIGIPSGDNLYQENIAKLNYIYKSLGKGKGSWHAVVLVGYSDNKSAFQFLNSWGTDWGERGYAWIDYDFFLQVRPQMFYAQDSSLSGRGIIEVTSTPSGANIYMNGSYKGTTPLILANLSPDNYTIAVSKKGYRTYNTSVQLTGGKNSHLYTVLQLAAPPNPPYNLAANYIGLHQIDLAWSDNSDDEDGFIIEQRKGKGNYIQVGSVFAGTTAYSADNLSVSTTYYYRIRAYNGSGYSAYSNEATAITSDISKRIIVVRNDMCDANKSFDGNYDKIENTLKRWRFPHTVVGKSEFDKDSYLLDDKIMVIFNCNRHGNHCCNPNHTLVIGPDGNALKCDGEGDCLMHRTELSKRTIDKIKKFVGGGGYLFTEDLQIDEILHMAFAKMVSSTGYRIKNRLTWEEKTLKVVPAGVAPLHQFLDGVFELSSSQDNPDASDVTVKINNYSPDIKILDKDAVTVLLISPDLRDEEKQDEGVVAITFKYYSSPEKYGWVVHLMGQLTGQDNKRSELALLKLLVNLLRDYNARGGK